ncbi:MAG: hypothetical protein HS108_11835 [Planctomycetes bacterium]|jgi:hypothetical protein|nr:hypothetical protein [Planctomycetota bacterium]MCL4729750.1 hypothetical protein [Planctomycetota bacterium]
MRRFLPLFAFVLGLAGCGGSGTNQAGTANTPANAPSGTNAPRNDAPANTPADPGAFRKLTTQPPQGWATLSKDGRTELERHLKKLPSGFDYIAAVTNKKAPGGTEGPEHWAEWTRHAAGAMLYRVSDRSGDPAAAVKEYAPQVAAGVPEIKTESGVAWTPLQGGEVMLAAFSNKHGTYLVVAVIMDNDNLAAHQQKILQWAQGIKPE